ncbi:hypothetical protein WUBG_16118, partial [Wuchereria bancrofti]
IDEPDEAMSKVKEKPAGKKKMEMESTGKDGRDKEALPETDLHETDNEDERDDAETEDENKEIGPGG